MFVAYLIPVEDHHLLLEDGVGFIAKGETPQEAVEAVRQQWIEASEDPETGQRDWEVITSETPERGFIPSEINHRLFVKEL